jgi:hypothetical protein
MGSQHAQLDAAHQVGGHFAERLGRAAGPFDSGARQINHQEGKTVKTHPAMLQGLSKGPVAAGLRNNLPVVVGRNMQKQD